MKYFILGLFLNFILINNTFSLENKIILKIENEIITSLDVENEIIYLEALNPNIKNLSKEKLISIAENSLIREKIKKNELLRYIKEVKLDQKFLSKLIKDRYSRLNLTNKEEFLNYLSKYNVDINTIEEKISIEALWNQLIYQKYSDKVKINKEELIDQIENTLGLGEKNYLLSEIVFKLDNKDNFDKKYSEIKNTISKVGFENAALTLSESDSSPMGGKLGWIKESSLNNMIIKNITSLQINDITEPIFSSNGYIILKIDDIKYTEKKYDKQKELKNLIKSKTNQQLNQYSNIYYNRIKKNTNINEF
tara:strand:- start:307 stop:1230 length:924 start_codon:yes stop_codon:yes gene_type:complete